jgi:signal transduction histidine kinase
VRLEVEDNGPGIPPEIITSIFDPFFTTKDVGQGSGLGLAITHEIITKHGGSISVESEPKKGTRFVITLPTEKCYLPETAA